MAEWETRCQDKPHEGARDEEGSLRRGPGVAAPRLEPEPLNSLAQLHTEVSLPLDNNMSWT